MCCVLLQTYYGQSQGSLALLEMNSSTQVEGCGRDAHRKRTCEKHLKLGSVMKDGKLQRFCHHCCGFHELAAFDGTKRCAQHAE